MPHFPITVGKLPENPSFADHMNAIEPVVTKSVKPKAAYTLMWSESDKTIILRRPGKDTIKFGRNIPQGVIRAEAVEIARLENATLRIMED